MKTIFYFIVVVAAFVFISNNASAQYDQDGNAPYTQQGNDCHDNRQQSFYYYPQSNVYYSFGTQQYIYPFRGTWTVSYHLPRYIWLDNQPRFVVNHHGFDVWNENRFHAERFRNYDYSNRAMAYQNDRRFNRRDDRFDHHDRGYNNQGW